MKRGGGRLQNGNRPMSPAILLVESHADLRSVIASALRRAHYDCDAVRTGGDALLKLREHDYAYIVVDVESSAPMSALRARLRSDPALLAKVVFISAEEEEGRDAELVGALHKPFDANELIARLRTQD